MGALITNQETEGLLSPFIRSVRLKKTAALIPPGSGVLDLACGGGFLKQFLAPGCGYYGVDCLRPTRMDSFDAFLQGELTAPDFFNQLAQWLPRRMDIITMLAFVEHVKAPEKVLEKLQPVLKPGGRVILTTPHPSGRKIHDVLARMRLCSPAAAAEHEQFLDRVDLERIARLAGYSVVSCQRFLFGLNQIIELKPGQI